jgi:hypothetical protein
MQAPRRAAVKAGWLNASLRSERVASASQTGRQLQSAPPRLVVLQRWPKLRS